MENKDITSVGLLKTANFLLYISARIKNLADKIYFIDFKTRFGQKNDDIYIVTYPKSGTTLMQMILYQLTTNGNIDFHHIYDVSPWIRNAAFRREKVPIIKSPRIIKSHDPYFDFERKTKGKFIFVYRNVEDVAISMYYQTKNYRKPNIELGDFLSKSFLKDKKYNWFNYTKDWLINKNKHQILYLKYEDILEDKAAAINKLIVFLDLKPTKEAIKRAIEHSSFEFMKEHEIKFGVQPPDKPSKLVFNEFIRKGKVGEGKEQLNNSQREKMQEMYVKSVKQLELKIFT
jgi:hypothetical protein